MPAHFNKDNVLNEAEKRDIIRKYLNSLDITNNSKGTPSDHDPLLNRRGWDGQEKEEWYPQS